MIFNSYSYIKGFLSSFFSLTLKMTSVTLIELCNVVKKIYLVLCEVYKDEYFLHISTDTLRENYTFLLILLYRGEQKRH